MPMCIESQRTPSQAYPTRYFMGRVRQETHVVWYLTHGYFPTDYLCHTCDNKRCVDPEHLFEGSNSDNQRDAVDKGRNPQAKKTHCPQGHEYSPGNTYRRPSRPSERQCRTCLAQSARRAKGRV